jgi:DNA-binding NarL/FixJ family response regulator
MTTALKIRVLLAEDHEVVRRGLRMVLEAEPDIEVVAEAADGAEAVEKALAEDS